MSRNVRIKIKRITTPHKESLGRLCSDERTKRQLGTGVGRLMSVRRDVYMFKSGRINCFIFTEACSCRLELAYFEEKYLKIDWSVKMPLSWLTMGVAGS